MLAHPALRPPRHDKLAPPSGADHPPASARDDQVIRFLGCEIRPGCRELLVDGVPRALQPRPFDLLAYLIENRDRVVSHGELLTAVWNDAPVRPCSLAAAVLRLRKALGGGMQAAIRTYQRVGYRFVAQLEPAAPRSNSADGLRLASPRPMHIGMPDRARSPNQLASVA